MTKTDPETTEARGCGGTGFIEIPPSSPGPGEGEYCPGCAACSPRECPRCGNDTTVADLICGRCGECRLHESEANWSSEDEAKGGAPWGR